MRREGVASSAHRPRGFVPEQERGHTIGGTRLRSCLSRLGRLPELFQDGRISRHAGIKARELRVMPWPVMASQFPYYRTTPYISPFSLLPLSPTFYFYLHVHAPRQSSALRKGCKAELLSNHATADPLAHRFARMLSHFMT